MMLKKLSTRFALTAIAAALGAPLANADLGERFEALRTPVNVVDTIKGNDVRDSKDSTILRNDVELDPTHTPQTATSPIPDSERSARAPTESMNQDSESMAQDSENMTEDSLAAGDAYHPDGGTATDVPGRASVAPEDWSAPAPGGDTAAETPSLEEPRDATAGIDGMSDDPANSGH